MNDGNLNPRTSEETFEVLLDVMEKHFAALRILDYDSECKLTRSASFSELQTPCKTERFLFKKSYQPGSCESLDKKYTWEEIFDANSNTRQVKVPKVVKFGDDERRSMWKKTLPAVEIDLINDPEESSEKMNIKEEKMPEYMEVEDFHTDKPSSSLANPRKSFSSLFSIQSAPSTSFTANVSSNPFPSSLSRSSRSDITNLLHSQEDKIDVFNVSKSFGQFTFCQSQLNDSKESLCAKKPVTSSQDCNAKENNIKEELQKGKKRLRPLMRDKKKTVYSCSCWQIIFFLLLPVAVFLISTILNHQQIGSKFCEPSFNFTNVTENLQNLVHGQTQGVAELVEFLETNVLKFKIIALVGGTGVGKSHVANIMKNSLPESYYVFEYFPPFYNIVRQAYSVLSTCRCNLIILENLGTEDISDAAFFSHALQNRASDLCVLILALFNTQVTDNNLRRSMDLKGSVANIENGFRKEEVEIKAIGFEPLREESVMKCIEEAIKESRLKLSKEDINQIRKSLLIANSGCKGAYSKVQLLGKIPNETED